MMKKNLGIMVVVAAMFTSYSAYEAQNERDLTGLALANVEALANLEGNECHYSNGVTNIQLEPSRWHTTKHHYYDCCAIPYDGYDFDDKCI